MRQIFRFFKKILPPRWLKKRSFISPTHGRQESSQAKTVIIKTDPKNTDEPGPTISRVEPQISALAIGLVDVYDEIAILLPPDGKPSDLKMIQSRIRDLLEREDIEIVRQEKWDSARMRAVQVAPPRNGEPDFTVLETISSGISRDSKILKKQEVVISRKPSASNQ